MTSSCATGVSTDHWCTGCVAAWLEDKAVEQGALTVLDACLREHADDEDLYNMAVAAFLRIADCGQSPPLSSPHSSC